jgi:hypothetical protein
MTHLSETEFIDLLEGTAPAERARHVDECAMCRTQIDHLRAALASGIEANVPEPSPLFWDHFAQRVQDGLGAGAARGGWWAAVTSMRALTAAGAIAAIVLIAVLSRDTGGRVDDVPAEGGEVVAIDPLLEPNPAWMDEGWAAVRAAAEKGPWGDAQEAALAAHPDAADRAIEKLTEAERARLLALLAEDLKKSGE